jgi:hypothetical protein
MEKTVRAEIVLSILMAAMTGGCNRKEKERQVGLLFRVKAIKYARMDLAG